MLPLLSLTRDGARREVMDEVIHEIQQQVKSTDQEELLEMSLAFASLAFEREEDQSWLLRRFAMLEDILNETPFVKFLEARGEQHGREEGFKQSLLAVVSARFPTLVTLTQEQAQHLQGTELLSELIRQISVAQTADEARQYIVTAGQSKQA